jgi:thioredoxin 1
MFYRCPPCKAIAPTYDALARQYGDTIVFLKVNVDKVPTIKSILSVWAMPSFYFIKHSKVIGSFMGANESKLRYGLEHDGNLGICSSSCLIL